MADLSKMSTSAISIVVLAVVVVMGLAVLGGFKDTGLVTNATVDLFISGLGIFGTFIGIVALAIVAIIIIGMFKRGKGGSGL